MTTPRERPLLRRNALARVRSRFVAKGHPRVVIFTFVTLAGLAAFGFSVALFNLAWTQAGVVVQWAMPSARTIGDVLR